MICPHCRANLIQANTRGEKLLRNRGLVYRESGLAAICPKCKADVPFPLDELQSLHRRLVLFFQKR